MVSQVVNVLETQVPFEFHHIWLGFVGNSLVGCFILEPFVELRTKHQGFICTCWDLLLPRSGPPPRPAPAHSDASFTQNVSSVRAILVDFVQKQYDNIFQTRANMWQSEP